MRISRGRGPTIITGVRMRKPLLKVALATGVLLTASNAARSELIVNGSFEQGE